MTKIWMDVDTGVDDAIALLCALRLKNLELLGVTAVGGNQTLAHTFQNTRDVLYIGGRKDIKVYKGAAHPLEIDLKTAEHAHGGNGLGGAVIPASDAPEERKDGIEAMYECIKKHAHDMVLVATGPLTDVALLLRRYPDVVEYLDLLAIMGGGVTKGNITPYAEFNIYTDPLAAREVFESGLQIVMCGLEVTHRAYLKTEEVKEISANDNWPSRLMRDSTALVMEHYEKNGQEGLCVHDGCPVFYLDQPEMFETKKAFVSVIKEGEKAGQTVADFASDNPNCTVVLDLDRQSFAEQIMAIYKNYGRI